MVIGAGPIGPGAMQFARIAGAKVIALDICEQRIRFCQNTLHIPFAVSALAGDVTEPLKAITNSDMPTVVIDASGSRKAINNAFQYLAHGGRCVLIGLQKGDISFSHPEFHKREGILMSSRNATRQDFEQEIACIKKGELKPAGYITHQVAFEEVAENFERWLHPASGVLKAMVRMI